VRAHEKELGRERLQVLLGGVVDHRLARVPVDHGDLEGREGGRKIKGGREEGRKDGNRGMKGGREGGREEGSTGNRRSTTPGRKEGGKER
jgi:hypothetical protein